MCSPCPTPFLVSTRPSGLRSWEGSRLEPEALEPSAQFNVSVSHVAYAREDVVDRGTTYENSGF
jgi:hypothetical protein